MMRSIFKIPMIILSLFFIFTIANAQETTTETIVTKKIITPAPQSESCTTITAHWEGNVWYDNQTICTYSNRTEGVAWVQDYWACTHYDTTTGDCLSWEYKPGYWVKTIPQ